ncbi:MAG: hypothetical protein ACLU9S_05785 [Oscillospiraceae bacterium]
MSLNVTLCGLPLDNPVIPASGTFGYGAEFAAFYDINILGTLFFAKGHHPTAPVWHPRPDCRVPLWDAQCSGLQNQENRPCAGL